ncbi:hypothetical protein NMY22_g10907 [Coprinellus aureogranulatus]|nr:hypothetical protein NMY22_g10907 [Coprinellus aureogranulatus]
MLFLCTHVGTVNQEEFIRPTKSSKLQARTKLPNLIDPRQRAAQSEFSNSFGSVRHITTNAMRVRTGMRAASLKNCEDMPATIMNIVPAFLTP